MGLGDLIRATDARALASLGGVGETVTVAPPDAAGTTGLAVLADEAEIFEEGSDRQQQTRQRTIRAVLPRSTWPVVERGWTIATAGVWVPAGTYVVESVESQDHGATTVRAVRIEAYRTVAAVHGEV